MNFEDFPANKYVLRYQISRVANLRQILLIPATPCCLAFHKRVREHQQKRLTRLALAQVQRRFLAAGHKKYAGDWSALSTAAPSRCFACQTWPMPPQALASTQRFSTRACPARHWTSHKSLASRLAHASLGWPQLSGWSSKSTLCA